MTLYGIKQIKGSNANLLCYFVSLTPHTSNNQGAKLLIKNYRNLDYRRIEYLQSSSHSQSQ